MEPALTSPSVQSERLYRNRNYMLLLCAKIISRFGDSIDSIAYSWMVYMLTGSKLLMGTLFAVNSIPSIVLSLFSGVFVDRWPKKIIVIVADYGRGSIVCLTALLFSLGLLEPWHLFVFTILNSSFEAFAAPAEISWIPRILPKSRILQGNSLSSSASQTAELMGLAAAGAIIAFCGISGALWLDAATFIVSGLLTLFVAPGSAKEEEPSADSQGSVRAKGKFQQYLHELKEGFSYVKTNRLIFTTILLAALVNFCLAPLNVLNTVYVKELLHGGPALVSSLSMGLTLGMILTGLGLAKWGDRCRKSTLILSGILLLGLGLALLSLPPWAPDKYTVIAAISLMFLIGVSVSLASSPLRSYVMEVTPGHMLGRVAALINMLCLSAMPLGGALTGAVADAIPIPILYGAMGSIIAAAALLLTRFRSFRKV
ncbi:MFS transporter [Paenibacillus sp. CAA11]|uniref:MFS transporter n=1 Tax=Paenibacillus sp. CAA11 TaxID=1532905 RepID=UPI000D36D83A|nr:MFS transporter [Paenibacillus sp. CAA11]AWB43396.1 MFS transporter [Paenibacillus sp. CAA11]